MRTLFFSAALFFATCLSAQTQYNLGEWYVLHDDRYDGVQYIDYDNAFMAQKQLKFTLKEFGLSVKFGTLVEDSDGFYYYEWEGGSTKVYITYMMNRNDPNFFRISLQYM